MTDFALKELLLLDWSLPSAAENLAADEFLLSCCEKSGELQLLRFWEPTTYFVVVGYGNKVAEEVNLGFCQQSGIGVYRRCSGGGTVLQGPGCLNYALILKISDDSFTRSIPETNVHLMHKQAAALHKATGAAVTVQGYTDLTIKNYKVSGNAQKRGRTHLLFHGTLLLNLDLAKIGDALKSPPRMPDYRQSRSHIHFVSNLPRVSTHEIKKSFCHEWQARQEWKPDEPMSDEWAEKYRSPEWNFKF